MQVALRAGDVLLWDSRTVHCNQGLGRSSGGGGGGGDGAPMLCRLVAFVCMVPRSALDEACTRDAGLRERRRKYVREGHTGPHHPLLVPEPAPGFWGFVQPQLQPQPPGTHTTDAAVWALVD